MAASQLTPLPPPKAAHVRPAGSLPSAASGLRDLASMSPFRLDQGLHHRLYHRSYRLRPPRPRLSQEVGQWRHTPAHALPRLEDVLGSKRMGLEEVQDVGVDLGTNRLHQVEGERIPRLEISMEHLQHGSVSMVCRTTGLLAPGHPPGSGTTNAQGRLPLRSLPSLVSRQGEGFGTLCVD